MDEQKQVCCPKCGSNQITANKKGFSGKKAVAGVVLTGGIGLLAGTIGSNKILITCLNCGNQFKPELRKTAQPSLVWNEASKQHVRVKSSDTVVMPLWKVLAVILIIIGVVVFLAMQG